MLWTEKIQRVLSWILGWKRIYNFKNNPLTKEKVFLGRNLFYDPILSRDNSISCSSCHSPFNAFTHVDHNLSHGIEDRIGTRNSPTLMNLAWHQSFMWDGAINHLDMQALAPISHPAEMDEKIEKYILDLIFATRYPEKYKLESLKPLISFGSSPRGSINLATAAKCYAFIKRRGYVIPEDVRAVIHDVLRHRIGITYEAEAENVTSVDIINKIVNEIEVP
jgi:hypothetical protein